ncbi:portal protein [Mycobacterium phage Weirdo19]|uniref:Portal protein n=1 Tax=Mycobacterium phage Weirdo19 TaxID=2601610 RepID=A0A6M2YSR4_9CAUD|nr:portal protein [Mycobacterium phage Weirdo19]QEA10771.1 portal protein [Mycobacterium phage Weirdo19]
MGANYSGVIRTRPTAAVARRVGGASSLRRPAATAPVKTAMPLGERGYVNGGGQSNAWLAWDPFEKVPQLQHPESVGVFLDMDNDDSRVTSLLESMSLPIQSATWRIEPNGAPAEAVALVSRVLRVPVVGEDNVDDGGRARGRFSWLGHLQEVASPVPQFGHAVFEQVYRREADGRVVLRKLGPRPQWTIQSFNAALDGGLDSITQIAPASSARRLYGLNPFDLPVNRLVVYSRNKRPGRWEGRSVLRSSYKHWLLKNELLKIEVAVARRNGMGVPVGTASKPNDPNEVKAMQRIAAGFRGGLHSGVGLAAGQSLTLLGVQGNLPDIRASIEYHDKAIALSGLAHFLNLDRGGSYALASVQERPFVQALNAAALSYAEIAQAHIIEDLIDLNFGTDTRCPRLVFSPIGSQQDSTAASLKMLVEAGLLAPDLRIERALRQVLDLPAKPEDGDPDAEPPRGTTAPAGPPQTSAPADDDEQEEDTGA